MVQVCDACITGRKNANFNSMCHDHCRDVRILWTCTLLYMVSKFLVLKARHLGDSAVCTACISRLEVPEQALDGISLDSGLV